jgi:hypothetical protein
MLDILFHVGFFCFFSLIINENCSVCVFMFNFICILFIVPCKKIQYYAILTSILNYYNISLNFVTLPIPSKYIETILYFFHILSRMVWQKVLQLCLNHITFLKVIKFSYKSLWAYRDWTSIVRIRVMKKKHWHSRFGALSHSTFCQTILLKIWKKYRIVSMYFDGMGSVTKFREML